MSNSWFNLAQNESLEDVFSKTVMFFSRMQKLAYNTIYFSFSKFALNAGTLASLFNINQYQTSGIYLLTFSAV